MSWIDEPWMQSAFESLRATFYEADPKTKQEMIQFLLDEGFWDSGKLSWEGAVARFNACLNPSKSDTFFKIGEAWALMKRFGRHHLFLAMAEDLGYDVSIRPTEARRQALLERIAIAAEKCAEVVAGAQAELTRLDDPTVPTVSGIARIHVRPKFSRSCP